MWYLQYQHKDADGQLTGQTAELQGNDFVPLGWADLVDRRLGVPSKIALRFESATVLHSSLDGIAPGAQVQMSADVHSPMTTLHLALLPDGWLPAGLAIRDGGLLFPDRCTLTELKGRFKRGRPARLAADFIDLFDRREARINPLLIALEGNTRSIPTRAAIQAQVHEVNAKFRELLPSCHVVAGHPQVVAAMSALSEVLRESVEKTINFLMSIARLLRHPVRRDRMESVLLRIAHAARDCALPLLSMPVLTAFSAAACTGRVNPAHKALKLTKQLYTPQDAYNAASDLRSLQIFAMTLATLPQERPMLVTGDKDLALIWLGARMGDFRMVGSRLTFGVDPRPEFLPPEAMAVWRGLALTNEIHPFTRGTEGFPSSATEALGSPGPLGAGAVTDASAPHQDVP